MARRKDDGLFALLAELPWWASILAGGVVYLALKYGVVGFTGSNFVLMAVTKALQTNAGFFASLFLIPALISFFKSFHRRKLLDRQSGLESIRAMSWREFEMLCGEAFRRKGYAVEENGLGGADGGVDLILRKNGETCLVQCKRWKTYKVGVKEVRELYGIVAAEGADRGILIASGAYTAEAVNFARGKPLDLIDGPALLDLVREVQKDPLQRAPIRNTPAVSINPVASAPSSLSRTCPRCGGDMVLRTAKRGSSTGERFWGCSNFPKCRAVLKT